MTIGDSYDWVYWRCSVGGKGTQEGEVKAWRGSNDTIIVKQLKNGKTALTFHSSNHKYIRRIQTWTGKACDLVLHPNDN